MRRYLYCWPVFQPICMAPLKAGKNCLFFLLTRGLWLVLVELFIVSLFRTFNPYYTYQSLQVIWAIGISMIVLSAMIHANWYIILVTGIVLVAGHNLLDNIHLHNFSGLCCMRRAILLLVTCWSMCTINAHSRTNVAGFDRWRRRPARSSRPCTQRAPAAERDPLLIRAQSLLATLMVSLGRHLAREGDDAGNDAGDGARDDAGGAGVAAPARSARPSGHLARRRRLAGAGRRLARAPGRAAGAALAALLRDSDSVAAERGAGT